MKDTNGKGKEDKQNRGFRWERGARRNEVNVELSSLKFRQIVAESANDQVGN